MKKPIYRLKPKEKTTQKTISLYDKDIAALNQLMEITGLDASEIIRQLIYQQLELETTENKYLLTYENKHLILDLNKLKEYLKKAEFDKREIKYKIRMITLEDIDFKL